MKKAKQILSLMLVIAMALGMMVFVPGTASAKNVGDYPDADSIEHKEAVDVLSALGVLLGDDSGAFNPKNNITREQAAKIITYILIGTTAADRLAPRTSSFTDVETSRWSNPYIEYCVEKGIIKGYGDGRFGPADPVTASQMAKMLLMCIGYGALGEYDNANSWELNTIVDGQKRGILTLDEDYTQPASREEVALYAFNAIADEDAFLVSYSDLLKQYMPRGSMFTAVSETYLINETFRLYDKEYEDSLGYTVRDWRFNTASNVNAATATYRIDVTIGKSAAGSQLTMPYGGSYYGLLDKTNTFGYISDLLGFKTRSDEFRPVEIWVNGEKKGFTSEPDETAASIRTRLDDGEFDTLAGTRGVIVEFVDRNDDGVADKLVFIKKSVGVLTSSPSSDAFGTITLNGVRNASGGFTHAPGTVVYPADLKTDDVVLYYRDAKGITYVELAKSITGSMTAFSPTSGFESITFGGAAYYATGLTPSVVEGEPYETMLSFANSINNYFNQPATIFVDDGNAIIAVNPEGEGELDYLVVLRSAPITLSGMAQAQVVLSNGTVRNVTIASLKDGTTTYPNTSESGTVYQQLAARDPGEDGKVYTYSTDADGNYSLKAVTNRSIEGGTEVVRKANFNTSYGNYYVGNSSTVFLVRSLNPATDTYVFSVFTGVGNAPTYDTAGTRVQSGGEVVYDGTGTFAQFVYLKGIPRDTEKNTLLFYSSSGFTRRFVDGNSVFDYQVVDVEGTASATKTVTLTESAHDDVQACYKDSGYAAELYEVTYNADGIVTGVESSKKLNSGLTPSEQDMIWKVGVASAPSANNITFGTGTDLRTARYNGDTKVYLIDYENLFNMVTPITIADVLKSNTNIAIGKLTIVDGKPTDILSELYIVKRANAAAVGGSGLSDKDPEFGFVKCTGSVGDSLKDIIGDVEVNLLLDNGDSAKGPVTDFVLAINFVKVENTHVILETDRAPDDMPDYGTVKGNVYVFVFAKGTETAENGYIDWMTNPIIGTIEIAIS